MKNTKMPKTFMIYARKGGSCGYLRFVCRPIEDDSKGSFVHTPRFVKKRTSSSLFVNFDNTRNVAMRCRDAYGLEDISIIDSTTGKVYHVKNTKTMQED